MRLPEGTSGLPGAVRLWPYQREITDAIRRSEIERRAPGGFTALFTGIRAFFDLSQSARRLNAFPKYSMQTKRDQTLARRVARAAYPYPGCCLCGQTVGVEIAHLDHNSANNEPDNLAWLCRHHHWLYDVGLFSIEALKLQRAFWQAAKGNRTNEYMKDAGQKAALTRAKLGIGHQIALKAVATRRARAAPLERSSATSALADAPDRG